MGNGSVGLEDGQMQDRKLGKEKVLSEITKSKREMQTAGQHGHVDVIQGTG